MGRTLTGLAPAVWSHDGTDSGVFDLVGNIWDLVAVRVYNGEIQVIPDNDSALNLDESKDGVHWRAIDVNGNYVSPGSPNTLKYDGVIEGIDEKSICVSPGGIRINTDVQYPQYTGDEQDAEYGFSVMPFEQLKCADGINAQSRLIELGLYPASEKLNGEMLFMRSYGERIPARGASWYDGLMGDMVAVSP